MAHLQQTGMPVEEPMTGGDGRVRPSWSMWLQEMHKQGATVSSVTALSTRVTALETGATATAASIDASNANIASLNASAIPVGSYLYSAQSVPPAKHLAANGSIVSRATYAALFTAIGTVYGIGDGSTTFGLPNPVAPASTFIYIRFEA